MRLNLNQKKQLAEISGNVAVVWFTLGVASTFFNEVKDLITVVKNLGLGLILTIIFIFISLKLLSK